MTAMTMTEAGKKGGSVSSEAKRRAAIANAKKPRKSKKPMPEIDTLRILKLAALELETERDRCLLVYGEHHELMINGHGFISVLNNHIARLEA